MTNAAQLPRCMPSDAAEPPSDAAEPPSEPAGPGRVAAHQSVSVATAMRELFEAADADGSGTLDAEEVASFVRIVRPAREMCAIEVSMAMDAMTAGGDGQEITFKQFERWWMDGGSRTPEERRKYAQTAGQRDPRESVRAIFQMIDIDGGGSLDRDEIRKAGTVLGKVFSGAELDTAMSVMDKEQTGEVCFESFYAWYTSHRSGCMTDQQTRSRLALTQQLEQQKLGRKLERESVKALMEAHARIVGVSKMRAMFQEIDADGSGYLDSSEVAAFVRKLKPTKFMGSKQVRERKQAASKLHFHSSSSDRALAITDQGGDGRDGSRQIW